MAVFRRWLRGRSLGFRPSDHIGYVLAIALVLVTVLLAVASPARAEDKTPPQVTSFSMSPLQINTESADQTVTVTMTITDDQAGVASEGDYGVSPYATQMTFAAATGGQRTFGFLHRVSGTDTNGVYTTTLTLSRGTMNGVWRVEDVILLDKIGNRGDLDAAALEAKFGFGCATVTNTAADSDTTPPQITAFSITPKEINTESADQTVTATMTITDDQAGLATEGDNPPFNGISASGSQMRLAPLTGTQNTVGFLQRISGTDMAGVYTATLPLMKSSKAGIWHVSDLDLRDKLGNDADLNAAALEAKFGAGCASVTNTATLSDGLAPQVTAFSMTPSEVNTETASQTVTVTMTLTDDMTGVASLGDCPPINGFNFGESQITIAPLIGNQQASGSLTRVSGTDTNGVYTTTLTLPQGSKVGIWQVSDLSLRDKIGNRVDLDANALNAALPSATGLIIANTATAQQVIIERNWTISSAHASVTFPAGTVVTRADTGRFAFYEMTAQQFTLDGSIPTTGLDGTPLATLRFGIPGLNLSFSKPVTVSMEVGSAYEGYVLSIQSLTEGAVAWANEAMCSVWGGRVQFTVNHATKFVANLMNTNVAKASVTKLSPTSGKRGATVTIIGKDFGAKRSKSVVKFGTKVCTKYVSWSATRIKVKVPAKAKFGKLMVTVRTSGGTSNAKSFRVKR